ncbi:hypothetical protein FJZ23_00360 [Candidatus Parcubacteria bacterium]|nr:hypothetical protein [Candidatus Parcubacteria bacterium]
MSPSPSLILLVGSLLVILALLACLLWIGGLLIPLLFHGAPLMPSQKKRVATMMRLAQFSDTDHVVDMGSGDGMLLFAALTAGAGTAEGYEIYPALTAFSRWRAKRKGLDGRVRIHQQSYWNADLSKTDVVLLYQLQDSMARLEQKLRRELPEGARVVSNTFTFPTWKPVAVDGQVSLYKK